MIDVGGDKSYLYGDDDLNSPGDEQWRSPVTKFTKHPNYTGPGWKTGYDDGRTGICSGDSGGPLVVDDVIIGITSWGAAACDRYSVFARLTNEMGDWAHEQIQASAGDSA